MAICKIVIGYKFSPSFLVNPSRHNGISIQIYSHIIKTLILIWYRCCMFLRICEGPLKKTIYSIFLVFFLIFQPLAQVQADSPSPAGTILYMPIISMSFPAPQWLGPYGGSVVCLCYHPQASGLVFAGTWGGGVYKSTNGGIDWTASSAGLENLYINSLAVDPQNPAVVYAGTYTQGVYKSINGGVSWQPINNGIYARAIVYSIAVDPQDSNRVYIGTRPQLDGSGPPWNAVAYRSFNGGETWEEALTNVGTSAQQDWVYSLAVNPRHPNQILAATHEHGAYRSEDYGDSWHAVNSGMGDGSGRSVVFAPLNGQDGTAYFGVWHRSGVYKTLNSGDGWTLKTSGIGDSKIYTLDVSSRSPDLLFAATFASPGGGAGLLKSVNSGESWTLAGLQSELLYTVAANPFNSAEVLTGSVGNGLFRSTTAGGNWSSSNQGLSNIGASSVVVHPQNSQALAAAVPGVGVYYSTDRGSHWNLTGSGLGDTQVNSLAADPNHPDVVYALTQGGGLYKAAWSNGLRWSLVGSAFIQNMAGIQSVETDIPNIFAPLQDPVQDWELPPALTVESTIQASAGLLSMTFSSSNPNVSYLGTDGMGVFHSADGGLHWSAAGLGGLRVSAISVDPDNENHLLAAINSSNSIQESFNGGSSWTAVGPAGISAVGVEISPTDSTLLYAAGNGVFRKIGGGAWEPAGLQGTAITAVGVSPYDARLLLAAAPDALFISSNGGDSWINYSAQMVGTTLSSIRFDPLDAHSAYVTTTTHGTARVTLP